MNNLSIGNLRTLQQRFIASVSLLALAGVIFALPSIHAAKAESNVRSDDAGAWLVVTHKVEDYKRWLPVHERTAAIKRNFGWKKCEVFAVDGDRNHVMVMEQFGSLERAKAFANSHELTDEMAASGVSSQPEMHFITR